MWNGSRYFYKKHNIYFTCYWKGWQWITPIWKQLGRPKWLVWEIRLSREILSLLFKGLKTQALRVQQLVRGGRQPEMSGLRQLPLMSELCLLAYQRIISVAYHFILQTKPVHGDISPCLRARKSQNLECLNETVTCGVLMTSCFNKQTKSF